ncbi:CHAP domain-containing protein [Rhizobacter sp. Root1221]|uniref:CHAP domain-containing protein n=1 Tax=Rhizobacter sp. Root1221 TaxID=1736433 RepID=UPI0007021BEE|nr:CHAP domain-containing protein [Rhizobacter sp. Root1221]
MPPTFRALRSVPWLALVVLAAIALLMPRPAAAGYACNAAPSAYIDGQGGRFDDTQDSTGFPVFNKNHCYGNPIYSTNGKDTYTTNPNGNRTMTNSGFGYQCYELAQRYFGFKFNKWIILPAAADLCDGPMPAGVRRFRPGQGTPVPGDLFVFGRGSCGVSAQFGHVGVVTKVYNTQKVQIAQQNVRNEASTMQTVDVGCACVFIHAEDNLARNGAPSSPPDGGWSPNNPPGEGDGPIPTGGGNLIGEPANLCRCSSNDPNSVWPLCCKK